MLILHFVFFFFPDLESFQRFIPHQNLHGDGALVVWFGYLVVDKLVAKVNFITATRRIDKKEFNGKRYVKIGNDPITE